MASKAQLVARLAGVRKSVRDALLGSDAGALWEVLAFTNRYRWFPRAASRGINELAARQAGHARCVTIYGGHNWDHGALRAIASPLAGFRHTLRLMNIEESSEAAVIGASLVGCLASEVAYYGTTPCAMPREARKVSMLVGIHLLFEPYNDQDQARILESLQPLFQLRELSLDVQRSLTDADICRLKACHAQLRRLQLKFMAGQHAVASLPKLDVQLELTLAYAEERLSAVLRELQQVALYSLKVVAYNSLTAMDELLLSRCSISSQLVLCVRSNSSWRLQQVPLGLTVKYEVSS